MAVSSGILPTYRSEKLPHFPSRKTLRLKEKYILLLVFCAFGTVCFGGFFFLPEFSGKVSIAQIGQAGDHIFLPANLNPKGAPLPKHPGEVVDVHRIADKARLLQKIEFAKELDELPRQIRPPPNAESRLHDSSKTTLNQTSSELKYKPHYVAAVNLDSIGVPDDDLTLIRRNKVKEMMKHAWHGYVQYAWGENELRPVTKRGHTSSIFGSSQMGATIVDAIDTLYLMGLTEEYQKAKNWLKLSFQFQPVGSISVFEINIRFVGGLLSAYALTGDKLFKDKAVDIARKLLPAFNTPTGIPNSLINVKTGSSRNFGWASGGCSILAEFGSLHLEFEYLSQITGDPIYREKVEKIREVLRQVEKPAGLFPNYLNPRTGNWGTHHVSLGALGDSFYEYLLKQWLMSGRRDELAKEMYYNAIDAVMRKLIKTSPAGHLYLAESRAGRIDNKMDHLACFAAGMFGLGSKDAPNPDEHMRIAQGLASTCHASYTNSATGLGPESFRFEDNVEAKAVQSNTRYYILRPEVVEGWFYMWRLTKEQKYRDWAWDMVQALEKHCRTEVGFSGIRDVYALPATKDDVQQSFFLAETLKYLYLIFSGDDLLPLDSWVLNTEAHPLPVKGSPPGGAAAFPSPRAIGRDPQNSLSLIGPEPQRAANEQPTPGPREPIHIGADERT